MQCSLGQGCCSSQDPFRGSVPGSWFHGRVYWNIKHSCKFVGTFFRTYVRIYMWNMLWPYPGSQHNMLQLVRSVFSLSTQWQRCCAGRHLAPLRLKGTPWNYLSVPRYLSHFNYLPLLQYIIWPTYKIWRLISTPFWKLLTIEVKHFTILQVPNEKFHKLDDTFIIHSSTGMCVSVSTSTTQRSNLATRT